MKKSFTLIELLVVIAIIGMLSAMLLPNFMAARERARDTQRKSDLSQIQKAFEMYKQDQTPQAYPTQMPSSDTVFENGTTIYMNKFPADPSSTATTPVTYGYAFDNSTLTYILCTCLENIADPAPICSANGSLTCPITCVATKKCYGVFQP